MACVLERWTFDAVRPVIRQTVHCCRCNPETIAPEVLRTATHGINQKQLTTERFGPARDPHTQSPLKLATHRCLLQ